MVTETRPALFAPYCMSSTAEAPSLLCLYRPPRATPRRQPADSATNERRCIRESTSTAPSQELTNMHRRTFVASGVGFVAAAAGQALMGNLAGLRAQTMP